MIQAVLQVYPLTQLALFRLGVQLSYTLLYPCNKQDNTNYADTEFQSIEFANSISELDPCNYKAVISALDTNRQREACNTEISTLIANRTWELIELSQDAQVVQLGWVYKIKLNLDNIVE